MDNQRPSIPNVDRANSTLFKRYLDEQRKSVLKSNPYSASSRPVNTTLHIHHHHHQEDVHSSQSKVHYPTVLVKKKSHGRKISADPLKQRSSYASRFMKRFQRQYKYGDSMHNVPKREGRPQFEFYSIPSNVAYESIRVEHEANYPCPAQSRSPIKSHPLPTLSLHESQMNKPSRLPLPNPVKPIRSPVSILAPPSITSTANESLAQETISTLDGPPEVENPPPISSSIRIEPTTLFIDPVSPELSEQHYALLNNLLQELSLELTDKPSVDILLEIEGSLAQRIYDCIVEHDQEEMEEENQSHSTTTIDSSALSASVVPMGKSNDLPPSPINHREKYFQPIREPPSPPLNEQRHSTPFNALSKPLINEFQTPFLQSILEPVNLLRTVTTHPTNDENTDWNFLSGFEMNSSKSFSFVQGTDRLTSTTQQTFPFSNHLLLPRTSSIENNQSAFKPIESSHFRSYPLKRPTILGQSNIDPTAWFGLSQD